MNKKLFIPLLMALAAFTACSDDNALVQEPAQPEAIPVGFDVYTQRGTTRAGAVGDITTATLGSTSGDIGTAGFGVFVYYTNNEDYVQQVPPNFMYNQQVTYDGSAFSYTPLRYWPNEYGTGANSDDTDKLSFFAYAPYVSVSPSTGWLTTPGENSVNATWGITSLTRNTYTGDPLVKYIASFDAAKSVDLCWGVFNDDSGNWTVMNGTQTMTKGLPWVNVQRAGAVNQKLKFTFRHALAQLNVKVDAFVDGTTATNPVATGTKIYVRSISFTGLANQGALNLNNTTANVPLWKNYNGNDWLEPGKTVTVYDGLRDGVEGTAGATAPNETSVGLNPVIISDEGNTTAGVTNTAVNLFAKTGTDPVPADNYVYIIPTGEKPKVTIVYDVETAVPDLPGYLSDGVTHGTSIENRITKELSIAKFESGKSYTLSLHLGLNSVKFDAVVVSDWTSTTENVNLP